LPSSWPSFSQAEELAEAHANENGLLALHAEVVIPALGLAEHDRHAGALDERHVRFIFDTTRRIVEYVEDRREPPEEASKPAGKAVSPVCIVAAHDEADHIAGLVLARMLPAPEFNPHVIAFPLLAAETLDRIAEHASARLRAAGVDVVVTKLADAIDQLHQLTVPLSLELQQENQGRTTISRRR